MPELRVTFTLGERDLKHFRQVMAQARSAARTQSEEEILRGALSQASAVRRADAPAYVIERIDRLETIAAMVQDKDWVLPGSVRPKVLGALAYFLDPADLIPDHIPGLGFLDDAIMIELIAQDLKQEIWGYHKFCDYRDSAEQRPWTQVGKASLKKKLGEKRKQIRTEIQKRQARDAERAGTKGGILGRLW